MRGDLPRELEGDGRAGARGAAQQARPQATRQCSQATLNVIGAAGTGDLRRLGDLTGSNNTQFRGHRASHPEEVYGHYIHYGVREFGMTAVMNGIALHGGFMPYGGTFLVFSDYARNGVRLAALMKPRVMLVYTHDSVGLGEDGPTHQPIEHLTSLRAMPNLSLWRPCDALRDGDRVDGGRGAVRADCARADPPGAAAAAAYR